MKAQMIILSILLAGGMAQTAVAKSRKSQTQAQDASQTPSNPSSDKLDVTDLENKYWAPKDTDFSVVQNRAYTKEHKIFLSAEFGPDLSPNEYTEGNHIGLIGNYFFNERYGVQLTYLDTFMHANRAVGDLASSNGFPNYGILQNYYGVGFNWVPFYSKMSFLGKKILYFDMAITPTIGLNNYQQQISSGNVNQSALAYGFDVTQYYFFTSHWAFRIDLKNQWWDEKVVQYISNVAQGKSTGQSRGTQMDREMIFLFGFTYYFGLGGK